MLSRMNGLFFSAVFDPVCSESIGAILSKDCFPRSNLIRLVGFSTSGFRNFNTFAVHKEKISKNFHSHPVKSGEFDKKEDPCYLFLGKKTKENTWILKKVI